MLHNGAKGDMVRKRRKLMERPDGFTTRKQHEEAPKFNIPIPKFTSAFDEAPQATHKKLSYKLNSDTRPNITSKPQLTLSHQNTSHKVVLKQLTVPSLPLPSNGKGKERSSVSFFQVAPPPDPRTATMRETPRATISALHPAPLRPPPLPEVVPSKNGLLLKELPSPPVLQASDATADHHMRTISTTEIALATDLSTDSGAAELAHIFLHDQHPEIAASSKEESTEWNIGLSPQKGSKLVKGKGKEAKFIRGGLAARASELMTRSRTSLVLWQKEIELQLATSSPIHTKYHLRLQITHISSMPIGVSSGSPRKRSHSTLGAISPGVAFCRVVSSGHGHLIQPTYKSMERKDYLVVFSFPTIAPPRLKGQDGIYVRNPEDFMVGREVSVWEPWLEVTLPSHPVSGDACPEHAKASHEYKTAPFPILPSTYPQPSSMPQAIDQDLKLVNTVLLISRFIILPKNTEPSGFSISD